MGRFNRKRGVKMGARAVSVAVSALVLAANTVSAQTTSAPPPTQDAQIRTMLGLGEAIGCIKLLGITTTDQQTVAAAITAAKFGKELSAICGPSAVNSASSTSGGVVTIQAAKTVSSPRPSPKPQSRRSSATRPSRDLGFLALMPASSPALQLTDETVGGVGVFGGIQLDDRNRIDTPYESGYEATVKGFLGGVDYASDAVVAGGWVGTSRTQAEFPRFAALLSGTVNAATSGFLSSASNLSAVCGGLSTGGGFEDRTTQFGGFVGSGLGGGGFVEGGVGWTRLEHAYDRNVCAIEGNNGAFKLGTVGQRQILQDENGNPIDDIFAGTISGLRLTRELSFSVAGGAQVGNQVISFVPRAELTVRRAASDAYVETGVSTAMGSPDPVTGVLTVTPNAGDKITFTLGGPTGLELAFDAQTRTSIVLESGGTISVRAGRVLPYAGGFWRREFNDDFPVVTVRMAQDTRTTPTTFTFGQDASDRDSLLFRVGCVVGGAKGTVRVEWARDTRNALFSGRSLSALAQVRF
jgi:hypothetical protein